MACLSWFAWALGSSPRHRTAYAQSRKALAVQGGWRPHLWACEETALSVSADAPSTTAFYGLTSLHLLQAGLSHTGLKKDTTSIVQKHMCLCSVISFYQKKSIAEPRASSLQKSDEGTLTLTSNSKCSSFPWPQRT